jgi:hypothetical protein
VGYPAIYGNAKMMRWNQRALHLNASLPKQGVITRATTPSFWHGFRMMRLALTTLIGFDGKAALRAHRATDPRGGV